MFSKPIFIFLMIALNAIPLYGVFAWGWQSFDLIFLYWLENLAIGFFMILRMVIRPYGHPAELLMPLFLGAFFSFHYGMFCYVHGMFVFTLFGKDVVPQGQDFDLLHAILPLIEIRHLFWPFLALFAYQLLDWVRDVSARGLGTDGVKQLTVAPYRRIMVLHFTLLASGFALGALHEPVLGLLLLVIFKTGMDLYHWNKDEQAVLNPELPTLDEKLKAKVDTFLADPKITVNGKEIRYNSFEELKASRQYNRLKNMMQVMGGDQQLAAMEAYIAQREKEQGEASDTSANRKRNTRHTDG